MAERFRKEEKENLLLLKLKDFNGLFSNTGQSVRAHSNEAQLITTPVIANSGYFDKIRYFRDQLENVKLTSSPPYSAPLALTKTVGSNYFCV
ncbi:hypothetical protein C7S20_12740 [Christiangramia fulva]|uniref:Uncharacterized protein n=1 Tax=Christiangramia fulva TaxID=2126553 RepID=A0A2R3Z704_9FLAO|nr:hypothetical protein [Christiangramia fulva]AVR46051.1 hypothetical protein C7S20_12740 [Christiangramia fulva]